MKDEVSARLIALNREFYETFAGAFAATRRRIQPGIRKILADLPKKGRWLDLGCGSGALALEWIKQRRKGLYHGLDFSAGLLLAAEKGLEGLDLPKGLRVVFDQADLTSAEWAQGLKPGRYDGILAFAVLHHIPGEEQRLQLIKRVHDLLRPGGMFIHSEWQFQFSEKLMKRRLSWEFIGLSNEDVEPGDTLMDWRYALEDQKERVGYRYVHLFTRAELAELAEAAGFRIIDEFESDGEGGRLGLYQRWTRVEGLSTLDD